MRTSRYLLARVVSLFIVLATIKGGSALLIAQELCPLVNCDCQAISLPAWQERCLSAEQTAKAACVANNGQPKQYCGLQGPKAKPVALSTTHQQVQATTLKTLKLHKRQVVMLMWSIKDDLDNVRYREERQFFGDALQVHKLLDQNIKRLYATQRNAAEGERLRKGDYEAADLWRDYREEIVDVVAQFEAYGEVLWGKFEAATAAKEKKAYRLLSMRILRSASQLSEHLAFAYVGEGDVKASALAWQQSARMAQNLLSKEQQSVGNNKHIAYYRYQTAGRWNRASYYWMEAKDEPRIGEAVKQAELAVSVN